MINVIFKEMWSPGSCFVIIDELREIKLGFLNIWFFNKTIRISINSPEICGH